MLRRFTNTGACRTLMPRYSSATLARSRNTRPAVYRRGVNTGVTTARDVVEASEPKEPDSEVLARLVCPFSKAQLTYDRQARELLSPVGIAFPVTRSGIPNMMPSSARMIVQE